MIDTEFMIRYTNGLYSVQEKYLPRYNEFRDMFSSGQLQSNQWVVDELKQYESMFAHRSVAIAGAWFGTLGLMIRKQFPTNIVMIDIDPRCEKFINGIIYNLPGVSCVTEDMYEHMYTEDVVINTSCEHIPDLREWINVIPSGKLIVLQSNDFTGGEDHINCVSSKEEFVKQSGLTKVWYSGELILPMYTRYMIIGMT